MPGTAILERPRERQKRLREKIKVPDEWRKISIPVPKDCRISQVEFNEGANVATSVVNLFYSNNAPYFREIMVEKGDCLNEIAIALWKKAGVFDPTRGAKFTTVAYNTAKNRMIDILRAQTLTDKRKINRSLLSLGSLSNADKTLLPADSSARRPEAIAINSEAIRAVPGFVEKLGEKERAVIRLRYFSGKPGKPMSMKRIGEIIGLTESRASQLHASALARLETMLTRAGHA